MHLFVEEAASPSQDSPDEPKAKQRKVTKDWVGNIFVKCDRSPSSLARPPLKCTMMLSSLKTSSTRWGSHKAKPVPRPRHRHPRTGQEIELMKYDA